MIWSNDLGRFVLDRSKKKKKNTRDDDIATDTLDGERIALG